MIHDHLEGLDELRHDLCIIGSGPVGITLALEMARLGRSVLVLESGGRDRDDAVTELSAAEILEPGRHDDMRIAVARRFGGTSNLWAARCQPFDPIDFEARPWIGEARWPLQAGDLASALEAACAYAHCGQPQFRDPIPGVATQDEAFDYTRLERFSNQPAFQRAHAAELARSPRIDLRLNATVTDFAFDAQERVYRIVVARPDGSRREIPVNALALACGGLESTRLLLAAQRRQPGRFGGIDGPLGRYYMGHVIGEVADINFASDTLDRAYDFYTDGRESYARRRFIPSDALQRAAHLPNICFWPVVPPSADPRHRSAILSMVMLALSIPPLGRRLVAEAIRKRHVPDDLQRLPHVMNVVRGLPAAAVFAPSFLYRRYLSALRLPGFFVRNPARSYGLSYHAEHLPNAESRVRLAEATDRFGLPRLSIDLRFSARDAEGVLRAHDELGGWLSRTGFGSMTYRQPREATAEAILALAAHGTHQIGTVRMGENRREAVVDRDLRCFDCDNLFVAGSAVFPTSGQANPTLTAVALAVRLARTLAKQSQSAPSLRAAA
ncbi:choline dehydrogenase-like flavoprotein [Rhodoligotrophos appendicifer]|uniref:FAD-dependent oxidoreductase n=1 Tax=Rhodoligotrophos appendicifer TaxID=987056 RepID=UPI0011847B04|nr:FAD-dependent oxidoreductase [Rhodoligotrophos appendicifer]